MFKNELRNANIALDLANTKAFNIKFGLGLISFVELLLIITLIL